MDYSSRTETVEGNTAASQYTYTPSYATPNPDPPGIDQGKSLDVVDNVLIEENDIKVNHGHDESESKAIGNVLASDSNASSSRVIEPPTTTTQTQSPRLGISMPKKPASNPFERNMEDEAKPKFDAAAWTALQFIFWPMIAGMSIGVGFASPVAAIIVGVMLPVVTWMFLFSRVFAVSHRIRTKHMNYRPCAPLGRKLPECTKDTDPDLYQMVHGWGNDPSKQSVHVAVLPFTGGAVFACIVGTVLALYLPTYVSIAGGNFLLDPIPVSEVKAHPKATGFYFTDAVLATEYQYNQVAPVLSREEYTRVKNGGPPATVNVVAYCAWEGTGDLVPHCGDWESETIQDVQAGIIISLVTEVETVYRPDTGGMLQGNSDFLVGDASQVVFVQWRDPVALRAFNFGVCVGVAAGIGIVWVVASVAVLVRFYVQLAKYREMQCRINDIAEEENAM